MQDQGAAKPRIHEFAAIWRSDQSLEAAQHGFSVSSGQVGHEFAFLTSDFTGMVSISNVSDSKG